MDLMKFNKANSTVLYLCQGNPRCVHTESSPVEKGVSVLVDKKWTKMC